MKEQFISFETAKLAKEKRFDIKCDNCYAETEEHEIQDYHYGGEIKIEYNPQEY